MEFQNKCRGKNSRTAAYRFLLNILTALKPKELTLFLENDLLPMIKDLPKPDKWLHQPSTKNRYLFSGITNLGCICYMISILQQIYMVPQFRYLLLKAQCDQTDIEVKEWRGKMH
jgi:ubiquitin C-terminal hydrolase